MKRSLLPRRKECALVIQPLSWRYTLIVRSLSPQAVRLRAEVCALTHSLHCQPETKCHSRIRIFVKNRKQRQILVALWREASATRRSKRAKERVIESAQPVAAEDGEHTESKLKGSPSGPSQQTSSHRLAPIHSADCFLGSDDEGRAHDREANTHEGK